MPVTESIEQWRRRELILLRGIARNLRAYLIESTDPAMADVPNEIRRQLAELHQWRQDGTRQGYQ